MLMTSTYGRSMPAARHHRQILPDSTELKDALADPALDAIAEAGMTNLPPSQTLSLAEHRRAREEVFGYEWLSRRHLLKVAAMLPFVAGIGVLGRLWLGNPSLLPLGTMFGVRIAPVLSPTAAGSIHPSAMLSFKKDAILEFAISAEPLPAPPIVAYMFIRRDDQIFLADKLLQPRPRSQSDTSFYVEQPVKTLLERGALETTSVNELILAIGRPGAVPRTAEELRQVLKRTQSKPPEHSSSQFVRIGIRISTSGS